MDLALYDDYPGYVFFVKDWVIYIYLTPLIPLSWSEERGKVF